MEEICAPPFAKKRRPAPSKAARGPLRGLWTALASRVRRTFPGLAAGAAVLSLTCCQVPEPTIRQGLTYGFRTPKQAFESFRTAVQGDLLAEEYRCFSSIWRRKNGVTSLLRYGEVRDELVARIPQLRWAIYRAKEPELLMLRPPYATLQARIPGPLWLKDRYMAVSFYRQGYWEAYDEGTPEMATSGDTFRDPWESGLLSYVERYDSFRVTIDEFTEFTEGTAPEAILEVRAGWEWKILNVEVFDEPLEAGAIVGE